MSDHATADSLNTLIAIKQDARAFGFDWPNTDMIIDQVISECAEIRAAIAEGEPDARIQEEIGDLLHTAISLCLFAGYDVKDTLDLVNNKFNRRMQGMKQLTAQRGLKNLCGQDIEYMLTLWREVKAQE